MAPSLTLEADHADALLEPGPGARLGVTRTRGPMQGRTSGAIAWVLIEGGAGQLVTGDHADDVRARGDVFEGPGWSAVVGPESSFSLAGDLSATVVWRATDQGLESRTIDPATVPDEARGEGTTARRVRTYVSEGPLIVGETLNPPGGWSSWPPHRHEHEEAYLYRFDPEHGFGVHVGYDDGEDRPVIVRDGSIERITTGWHPVVAAPGFTMYYLWALAGDADTVDTRLDPRYA
ncbi:MAG: 5-deoxy-glucuronate isomerase [Acidimicrobiia bacterium]